MIREARLLLLVVATLGGASGCITIRTTDDSYEPPRPAEPVYGAPTAGAIYNDGADVRLFEDRKAGRVGDILTVKVVISDSAKIENKTSRSRTTSEDVDLDNLAGLEQTLRKNLPFSALPSDLIALDGSTSTDGEGSVDRKETLTTDIAAVITQVLPNGNLVIEGRQEVRVNFEVRELIVAGIVRPEDIAADNTIDSAKIAEARIAYGGRGQITDVQQPRYGQQFLDIILPF